MKLSKSFLCCVVVSQLTTRNMPRGDFSDVAALTCMAAGLQQIFAPSITAGGIGPFRASFDTSTSEVDALQKICGGFFLLLGCMLFTVRWNTVNGKLSGLACMACSANIAHTLFHVIDHDSFKPRLFYGYAAILFLTGIHLMFNANPRIQASESSKKK